MTTSSKNNKEKTNIIIVGGGISGFACGLELLKKNANFTVTILEASKQVGGRIRTDRFKNNVPVDTGASFIHGISRNPVAEIITSLGFDLHERLACPLFDTTGKRLPEEMDKRVENNFNEILAACAARKDKREESLEDAITEEMKKYKFSPIETRAFHWHLSNLEYSVNTDLSNCRNDGWDGDDPFAMEGEHCIVAGSEGMRVIIDKMQSRFLDLGGKVQSGCPVRSIDYREGEVIINDNPKLKADKCVVTVSLGVLQHNIIDFTPPLPELKQQAIDRLGFGLLNKVAILFPFKFWNNEEIFGYCSEYRGFFPIFIDLSCSRDFAVLGVLISGKPAEIFEQRKASAVVEDVLHILKLIYKDIPPALDYCVTAWNKERTSFGSYSYVKVGSKPQDYDVLAAPVGCLGESQPKLFFAGEATNRFFPASVHGAFLSGVREACRIDNFLTKPNSVGSDGFVKNPVHFPVKNGLFYSPNAYRVSDMASVVFTERFNPKHSFTLGKYNVLEKDQGRVYISSAGKVSNLGGFVRLPLLLGGNFQSHHHHHHRVTRAAKKIKFAKQFPKLGRRISLSLDEGLTTRVGYVVALEVGETKQWEQGSYWLGVYFQDRKEFRSYDFATKTPLQWSYVDGEEEEEGEEDGTDEVAEM